MSLKIYVASFFNTRVRLFPVAARIEALGHSVVSTWLQEDRSKQGPDSTTEPYQYTEQELAGFADRDYQEIRIADLLIVDTFDITHRGGREWEAGYAKGRGLPVWIVGPKRNVFHYTGVQNFNNWEECLDALRKTV